MTKIAIKSQYCHKKSFNSISFRKTQKYIGQNKNIRILCFNNSTRTEGKDLFRTNGKEVRSK